MELANAVNDLIEGVFITPSIEDNSFVPMHLSLFWVSMQHPKLFNGKEFNFELVRSVTADDSVSNKQSPITITFEKDWELHLDEALKINSILAIIGEKDTAPVLNTTIDLINRKGETIKDFKYSNLHFVSFDQLTNQLILM